MKDLKGMHNDLDTMMDNLVVKTLDLFKALGHKTAQCLGCKQEVSIEALKFGIGYCATCRVIKEVEDEHRD